jgi:GAF domain-containing protein
VSQDLDAIVDRARWTFRAQACSVMVHEPENGLLVFAAMSGEGSESLVGVKFPDTVGVAGWVLASREPLVLEDVARDRRFAEEIAEIVGYVPRRLMAAPLVVGDRVLGVLEVLDGPAQAQLTETERLHEFADEAAGVLGDCGAGE